jgi:O-antigen/teichoic acid export membrane protein
MNITVYARMTMVLSRLIIQIPLIYFFGIFGLAFGELFIYTFSAIFIKLLSKSSLSPYINFKYFKKYLTYGLPIFFISLVGILASTIERLIGTYYFNLEAIAEIGMLAFIGSLFIIITGQILSLFSQYSREYLIKTNDSEGLLGVYFVFTKMMLFFYSIFASIFYMILKSFIIPAYLTEYTNIIDYFVLIYLIFLIRISISILINWMLITGERLKIAYSSLLFCVIAIASALAISLKFDFTMEYLFFTVIVAALMQLGFLLFHCLNLSDIRGGRFWLIITLSLHILLPFLMIQNQHIEWLYFIYISVFTHLVINIYFIKVKNSYGHIKKTLFILRRKYE